MTRAREVTFIGHGPFSCHFLPGHCLLLPSFVFFYFSLPFFQDLCSLSRCIIMG